MEEEDCIYFALGFKSFDIERIIGTSGDWYEWTERSRKAITRTSFSKKSMDRIVQVLWEASKGKGEVVSRWKRTEPLAEIFCARNFNKYDRYINLINVRAKRRSVIIIPELTFNSGWDIIAYKVGRFILCQKMEENRVKYRLAENDFPYAEAVKSIKWGNRERGVVNTKPTLMKRGTICIDDSPCTQSEALQKSLVGNFEVSEKMSPPLNEVRRWANKTWKQAHGLNIYEMGNGNFLFEFADRTTVEQVISGDWIRNKVILQLKWWSPTMGVPKEGNSNYLGKDSGFTATLLVTESL